MKVQTKRILANTLIVTGFVVIGFGIGWTTRDFKPAAPVASPVQDTILVEEVELTDWQIFQIALAKTESEFDIKARGSSNDYGVLQITPILVREVNRLAGKVNYSHNDSFDPGKSFEMFTIIQDHYNPGSDVDRAIEVWNPGGKAIGYPKKIYDNIEFVKRYEAIRTLVKN